MSDQKNSKEVVPVEELQAIPQIKDRIDEQYVIAEISNLLTPELFYEFPIGGRTVQGISAKGAATMVSELAKQNFILRDVGCNVTKEEDGYIVEATVKKVKVMIKGDVVLEVGFEQALGHAFQPFFMQKKDGSIKEDDKAYLKACTKAIRNARLKLIPEKIKDEVLQMARDAKLIKKLSDKDVSGYKKSSNSGTGKKSGSGPPMTLKQKGLIESLLKLLEMVDPMGVVKIKQEMDKPVTIGRASEIIDQLNKQKKGMSIQRNLDED